MQKVVHLIYRGNDALPLKYYIYLIRSMILPAYALLDLL